MWRSYVGMKLTVNLSGIAANKRSLYVGMKPTHTKQCARCGKRSPIRGDEPTTPPLTTKSHRVPHTWG